MKMYHQQGAINVLLQGVAEGVVLQGLLVSVPETLHSLLQKNNNKHSLANHTRPAI